MISLHNIIRKQNIAQEVHCDIRNGMWDKLPKKVFMFAYRKFGSPPHYQDSMIMRSHLIEKYGGNIVPLQVKSSVLKSLQ